MADKKQGIPQPKFDKSKGKIQSMDEQSRLNNVALQCVWYMELAKGAMLYLRHHKRLTEGIVFRLQTEINMLVGIMQNWLGLTSSWVQEVSVEIKQDKDKWMEEVKKFADRLAPEKSRLVTKNLEGEMQNLIKREKLLDTEKEVPGIKGKGRVII